MHGKMDTCYPRGECDKVWVLLGLEAHCTTSILRPWFFSLTVSDHPVDQKSKGKFDAMYTMCCIEHVLNFEASMALGVSALFSHFNKTNTILLHTYLILITILFTV